MYRPSANGRSILGFSTLNRPSGDDSTIFNPLLYGNLGTCGTQEVWKYRVLSGNQTWQWKASV